MPWLVVGVQASETVLCSPKAVLQPAFQTGRGTSGAPFGVLRLQYHLKLYVICPDRAWGTCDERIWSSIPATDRTYRTELRPLFSHATWPASSSYLEINAPSKIRDHPLSLLESRTDSTGVKTKRRRRMKEFL